MRGTKGKETGMSSNGGKGRKMGVMMRGKRKGKEVEVKGEGKGNGNRKEQQREEGEKHEEHIEG